MDARYFITAAFSVATAGIFFPFSLSGKTKGEDRKAADNGLNRPNFIIIMADDLGYGDIGCFGSTSVSTPNLDRMASEGMILTDYHSNGPVSSPTRCALLTGRYQQRAGLEGVLLTNVDKHRKAGLRQNEVTFADVLSGNGYDVVMFGKWHLGYLPQYGPLEHGFSRFEGFLAGNVDYRAFVDSQGRPDWYDGTEQVTPEGYLTDVINARGISYIRENHDRPFCLYLAHGCPHSPYQGPDDPPYRTAGSSEFNPRPAKSEAETYADMINRMDEGIGRIFDAVRDAGIENDTFVIFVSDNGPTGPGSSGGFRGRKGGLFEGGHRVPAIVWMPGKVAPGTVSAEPVMAMDIFPTMLDLAGIEYENAAKPLDGKSFVPAMEGGQMDERPLFWKYRTQKAVRVGNMKYMEKIEGRGDARERVSFLFDLGTDHQEKVNLIQERRKEAAKMKRLLDGWVEDVQSETKDQTR